MKNNFFGEIIISVILIGVLIFFVQPVYHMMPDVMYPLMSPLLLIIFIILAATLWKETPGDERIQLHKLIASRFAYFAAIATLVVGILFQTTYGKLDPWLVITACILLLAKLLGIIYGHLKH